MLDIGVRPIRQLRPYAPGSVKVKLGDKVRRGDQLGEVGNTGNSQAPHLHLHVMDGASSAGLRRSALRLRQLAITAVDEAGTEDFDKAEATGSPLSLTARVPPQKLEKSCRSISRSSSGRNRHTRSAFPVGIWLIQGQGLVAEEGLEPPTSGVRSPALYPVELGAATMDWASRYSSAAFRPKADICRECSVCPRPNLTEAIRPF